LQPAARHFCFSLQDLYDSSRFNDDDEDELLGQQPAGEVEEAAAAAAGRGAALVLPRARSTKIKTAEFIKSSVNVKDCPKAGYPEFAVIGRSNVGKSSLINLLTGRKSLAMVSKTPGGCGQRIDAVELPLCCAES
jgi:hypothetical protein